MVFDVGKPGEPGNGDNPWDTAMTSRPPACRWCLSGSRHRFPPLTPPPSAAPPQSGDIVSRESEKRLMRFLLKMIIQKYCNVFLRNLHFVTQTLNNKNFHFREITCGGKSRRFSRRCSPGSLLLAEAVTRPYSGAAKLDGVRKTPFSSLSKECRKPVFPMDG
ncbi:MAG: hypothetical protein JWM59_4615 [Verrucomicrobiales bacterium]|nr:hypothetical protein [Verrucomicrobiales bacterium]